MFWITTVALAAFSLSSCVDASTSSLVLDLCKSAGAKKVTVCSVLGFNGVDGNTAYETIFSQGFGDQVVVSRDEIDIDVGSSDIAVALIKGVELNGDLNGLMVTMQNLLEEAIHRGRPSKLMVIIRGREENESDKMRIQQVAEEVWALLPKNIPSTQTLQDCLNLSVYGLIVADESAVSNIASKIRTAVEEVEREAGALSGIQVASLMGIKNLSSRSLKVSASESRAAAECSSIAEDFLLSLQAKLSGGSAVSSPILPASVIASAVSECLVQNTEKYSKELERHANSDALRAASYRAHVGLSAILQPMFRKSAASLRINSMRAFETLMLRIAPSTRLVAGLKSQATAILDNFQVKTEDLLREYSAMSKGLIKLDFPSVTMNEEEPEPIVESVPITLGAKDLLSEDEEEKKEKSESEEGEEGGGGDGEAEVVVEKIIEVEKIVGKKVEIPSTPTPVMSATYNILAGPWTRDSKSGAQSWGLGAEVSALRAGLAESCAERERFLFLSGAYNPYVRDMPIPPTKLSFNYLLDPAGLSYGRQYDKMYDEQSDGMAERRANPLQLPGTATIPFDPNDHPVPRDTTPWWRVIVDFYKGDTDED